MKTKTTATRRTPVLCPDSASADAIIIDPEFRSLIPVQTPEQLQLLENALKTEGCRDALVVWPQSNGTAILLDGHTRKAICDRYDIPYRTTSLQFQDREDAADWIDRNQLGRRNLTPEAASITRGRIYRRAKGRERGPSGQFVRKAATAKSIARQSGVTERTIRRDERFFEAVEAVRAISAEAATRIRKGEVTDAITQLPEAAKDPATLKAVADGIVRGERKVKDIQREQREVEKRKRVAEVARREARPLEGDAKFSVILADPPWRYEFSATKSRAIESHYPSMAVEDICGLDVTRHFADDAVLFLWSTNPKHEEALQVLEAWGFRLVTIAVWVKDKIGMGYYFRSQHELLLVGKRGNLPVPKAPDRPSSVIHGKRTKHSAKPEVVYELIEQMYLDLPKLELFGRREPFNANWTVWGKEA